MARKKNDPAMPEADTQPQMTEDTPAQSAPKRSAGTVRMVRDAPQHKGGPLTADVHPDEVDNYAKRGWRHAID